MIQDATFHQASTSRKRRYFQHGPFDMHHLGPIKRSHFVSNQPFWHNVMVWTGPR